MHESHVLLKIAGKARCSSLLARTEQAGLLQAGPLSMKAAGPEQVTSSSMVEMRSGLTNMSRVVGQQALTGER